jgi:hypothetical protein
MIQGPCDHLWLHEGSCQEILTVNFAGRSYTYVLNMITLGGLVTELQQHLSDFWVSVGHIGAVTKRAVLMDDEEV